MSQYFKDLDLFCDSVDVSLLLYFVLFEYLDGYFLSRWLVGPKSNLTESALSDGFA